MIQLEDIDTCNYEGNSCLRCNRKPAKYFYFDDSTSEDVIARCELHLPYITKESIISFKEITDEEATVILVLNS